MAREKMTKLMRKCPHCGTRTLKQDLEHLPQASYLDGCHCTKCGTKFAFNKAGKCPICKGAGTYDLTTGIGPEPHFITSRKCLTCDGKGKLK